MPQITFPLLQSINDAVSLAYNSQFASAPSVWDKFAMEVQSTGAQNLYPRLDMLKGLREWIGDRQVQSLSVSAFTIANKEFEETIGVKRTDIEDDQYGFLNTVAAQLGLNAKRLPDLLISKLLKNGHTTLCYDGQNFFDTAHPSYDSAGAVNTVANYDTDGSGAIWFLMCTDQIYKPVIKQNRRPFQMIPKFSLEDPNVFWSKEFEWGVDGRMNVGYGLWQYAYMSTSALTHANVTAARAAMMSYRRPDGSPMGLRPNLLMTNTAGFPTAKALAENEYQPGLTATPNLLRGMFTALENEWLN